MVSTQPFGQWVKERRKKLGLTQERLASLTGYASDTIRKIEAGRHVPSIDLAERLGIALKVPEHRLPAFVDFARGLAATFSETGQPPHNLPLGPNGFIGRVTEIRQMAELFKEPACRLITLTGHGGVGKTRLALQVAHIVLSRFEHGVWYVPLAGIDEPQFVVTEIAKALPLTLLDGVDSKVQVLNYLRDKCLLLLLDNFEHVLAESTLVADILAKAPDVKLIVTSWTRLQLQAEHVIDVPGLPYKRDAGATEQADAIRLFAERARQVKADFALEDNLESVSRICTTLEGLPLGIELAAAWLRSMTCEQIADELILGRTDLPTRMNDVAERHRSLRAVFDCAWQRLSSEERNVMRMLSVFRGGFTAQAALQVAGASLPILADLIDRSLLRRDTPTRYDMHEQMRRFAYIALIESSHGAAIHDRHLAYFLHYAESIEERLETAELSAACHELEQELSNIRAAIEWGLKHPSRVERGLRIVNALYWFWRFGRLEESRHYMQQGLAVARNMERSPTLAKTLYGLAASQPFPSRVSESRALFEQCLEIFRELGDERGVAYSLLSLATNLEVLHDLDGAAELLEESMRLSRSIEDMQLLVMTTGLSAALASRLGNMEVARQRLQELIEFSSFHINPVLLQLIHWLGAEIQLREGNLDEVRRHFQKMLNLQTELRENTFSISIFQRFGVAALRAGTYDLAGSIFATLLALWQEIENPEGIASAYIGLATIALAERDCTLANRLLVSGLGLYQAIGSAVGAVFCLSGLAEVAYLQAQAERAGRLLAYVERFYEPGTVPDYVMLAVPLEQRVAELRGRLDDRLLGSARRDVQFRSLKDGIAYALGE